MLKMSPGNAHPKTKCTHLALQFLHLRHLLPQLREGTPRNEHCFRRDNCRHRSQERGVTAQQRTSVKAGAWHSAGTVAYRS